MRFCGCFQDLLRPLESERSCRRFDDRVMSLNGERPQRQTESGRGRHQKNKKNVFSPTTQLDGFQTHARARNVNDAYIYLRLHVRMKNYVSFAKQRKTDERKNMLRTHTHTRACGKTGTLNIRSHYAGAREQRQTHLCTRAVRFKLDRRVCSVSCSVVCVPNMPEFLRLASVCMCGTDLSHARIIRMP